MLSDALAALLTVGKHNCFDSASNPSLHLYIFTGLLETHLALATLYVSREFLCGLKTTPRFYRNLTPWRKPKQQLTE